MNHRNMSLSFLNHYIYIVMIIRGYFHCLFLAVVIREVEHFVTINFAIALNENSPLCDGPKSLEV